MPTRKTTTPPRFKRPRRSRRVPTPQTCAGVIPGGREKLPVDGAEVSSAPGAAIDVPRPLSSPSGMALLPAEFFLSDALDLAPRLLGKFLRRDDVTLRITEVEAYRPNDTACHGRFGVTARTAPLFGPGGHAYVYMCYGIHMMLNIVADEEGVGAAVLIRSCSPVTGLKTIQHRRGLKTDKPVLLAGPGKEHIGFQIMESIILFVFTRRYKTTRKILPFLVGKALGLSTAWSSHPLYISGGLELLDGPIPDKILVGPRVGIEYASPEHVAALWRFAIADSPWISAPKNTLRSP